MKLAHRKNFLAFTLIEILVALVILAIALTAIVKAINDNLGFASYLQNKTIASWVGEDILARLQTGLITPAGSGDGLSGNEQMLGDNWYWQVNTEKNDNSSIVRVSIAVSLTKDSKRLANVIGFIRIHSS